MALKKKQATAEVLTKVEREADLVMGVSRDSLRR
jgi:hypothetical protein